MKKLLAFALVFISLKSVAQTTSLNVLKQTNVPDTVYTFSPGNLIMYPDKFTANADSIFINFVLYYTNPVDPDIYVTKESLSRWTSKVSVSKWSACFGTDGAVMKTNMNNILAPFKLQLQ